MSQSVVSSLLENALDYLLSAAKEAQKDDVKSLKYCVLHVAASVELALKARLYVEHWSLIFADVDKASEAALKSGDFKSADFQVVVDRLAKIAKVPISKENLAHLTELRKVRNCIQHYAIQISKPQASSLVAKACNFLVNFCTSELPDDLDEHHETMQEIKLQLMGFEKYVAVRMESIKGQLEQAEVLFRCPKCWQETMRIGLGTPNCPFCGCEADARELAEGFAESVIEECPECGEETLALRLLNNEDGYWLCTSCGYTAESLSRCSLCGKLTTREGACQQCWDDYMHRD
jgi:ribosomal protein L37AE/L43A